MTGTAAADARVGELHNRFAKLGLDQPLLIDAPDTADIDFDDDEPRRVRGRPRGYLISEAEIAALYRKAGCGYGAQTPCGARRP